MSPLSIHDKYVVYMTDFFISEEPTNCIQLDLVDVLMEVAIERLLRMSSNCYYKSILSV